MSTFSCTGDKCPVRDGGVTKCTAKNCEDRTPATNADRIRAMSDEELADKLWSISHYQQKKQKISEWLDWLRQEAST